MKRLVLFGALLGILAGCGPDPADETMLLGPWALRPTRSCGGDDPYLLIGQTDVVAYHAGRESPMYGDVSFERTRAGGEPRWLLRYRSHTDGSAQGIEFAITGRGDLVSTGHLDAAGELQAVSPRTALRLYKCGA